MKVLKWLDLHLEEACLAALLVILTVLTSVNVVLRYVFNSGIVWSDEVCRYCLIFSGFISIGYWIRHKCGICVDALVQSMPKTVQKVLSLIVFVFVFVFFSIMFRSSLRVLEGIRLSGQVSSTLQIPMTYVYSAPILGFGLAVLRIVQVACLNFMNWKGEK